MLAVLLSLAASDTPLDCSSDPPSCDGLTICVGEGDGCGEESYEPICLSRCDYHTGDSVTVQVSTNPTLLTVSRTRLYLTVQALPGATGPLDVKVTGDVVFYGFTTSVPIRPDPTSSDWKISSLSFGASGARFNFPEGDERPERLIIDNLNSFDDCQLNVFKEVRYRRDIPGITPMAVAGGVTWRPVPGYVFSSGLGSYARSPISFPLSNVPAVALTLTATGLRITETDAGGTRQATILDLYGEGFSTTNLYSRGQTVTVGADGFSGRSGPRFAFPYLSLSVSNPGSGDAVTRFTIDEGDWTGDGDIQISGYNSLYALNNVIPLSVQALNSGLKTTFTYPLAITLGKSGILLGSIQATTLTLVPASTAVTDVYIDVLTVPVVTYRNSNLRVIAGDVWNLGLWDVDLTVLVRLSLSPLAYSYTSSGASPIDLRKRSAPLTVGDDAIIEVWPGRPYFLNASWFPGSRYYIEPPSPLPTLSAASSSGWPGFYIGPSSSDLLPLVCGVDSGKFEVLLKDYDWYTDYEDPVYNPQTAKQTSVRYSDLYRTQNSGTNEDVTCVALKAVAAGSSYSVWLTYTEANALRLSPYEYRVSELSPETTKSVYISGQSEPSGQYYNTFPIEIDFDATPLRDCGLTFYGVPPVISDARTATLKASPGRISTLRLRSGEVDYPAKLKAATATKPLSVQEFRLSLGWEITEGDVDWTVLKSVDLPYPFYKTIKERVQRIPSQWITYINEFPELDQATIELAPRSLKITKGNKEAIFPAPSSGLFYLALQFQGTGKCLNWSTTHPEDCLDREENVEVGSLGFTGDPPVDDSTYYLDFSSADQIYPDGIRLLADSASWTAPANLIISPGNVAFDATGPGAKTISYRLDYPRQISLRCAAQSCNLATSVRFTRLIDAYYLSFGKPSTLEVIIDDLQLSGTASDPCFGNLPTACKWVEVRDAHLYSGASIPTGYALTGNVRVSGQVSINPAAFQAQALYLNEWSLLTFSGTVPQLGNTALHPQYNLTNLGRRTASEIVRDRHNNSIFGRFNRAVPYVIKHICGTSFPTATCNDWIEKLSANPEPVVGNDWGSGVYAEADYSCGNATESATWGSYWTVRSAGTGADPTLEPPAQCLFVTLTFKGGDPTTPHYSPPSDGAEEDSGLSSGTAAAIALGVILAIVIVVVVLLIVLGKLVFSRGSDAEP